MNTRTVASAMLLTACSFGAGTAHAEKAGNECDRLAASTFDATRPGGIAGVPFDQIDTVKALAACEAAFNAAPNDPRYQYQYGRTLQKAGRGGEAFAYYSISAAANFPLAKHSLAVMLSLGEDGVKVDYARAMRLYQEAAAAGVSVSMHNLAWMYRNGKGTAADKKQALVWYDKAAAAGYKEAAVAAADMLLESSEPASEDAQKAATYLRKLADGGDAASMTTLALAIKAGKVVPSSSSEMTDRLAAAAERGQYDAASTLALFYKENAQQNDSANLEMKYALAAFNIASKALPGDESGWLPYQRNMATLMIELAGKKVKYPGSDQEYKNIVADFGAADLKKITTKIKCGKQDVDFPVYYWTWSRDYPQTDPQFAWVEKARGCVPPASTVDAFRKLYKLARDQQVSWPDLVDYAVTHQTKPEATSPDGN